MNKLFKNQILCDDPSNPDPNKQCKISSKPSKYTKEFECIYCGRVMEKQIIDDDQDTIKYDEDSRGNTTNVSKGEDTTDKMLKNPKNEKKYKEMLTKLTEKFNLLEAGKEAIENGMEYYGKYITVKSIKSTQSKELKQINNSKELNIKMSDNKLLQGIVMLVIENRNIHFDIKKFELKTGWKWKTAMIQKENLRKIIGLKPQPKSIDFDEIIREKCNLLGIGEYTTKCIDIFDTIHRFFDGKQSKTTISCTIYFICQMFSIQTINEQNIAECCGVSVVTLRKTFEILSKSNIFNQLKEIVNRKK